jgi:predicted O-linked N-acetylglucosamine transferase (SPINDLY family)
MSSGDPARLDAALRLWRQGALDAAASEMIALVTEWPGWAEAHGALGGFCIERGVAEQGLAHLRKAVTLLPQGRHHWANYLRALERLGRRDLLEPVSAAYGAAFPMVPEVWLELARLHRQLRAWERADEASRRAMALAPGQAGPLEERGAFLLAAGRPAEATGVLETALKLPGGDIVANRLNLAAALLRTGRLRDSGAQALAVLAGSGELDAPSRGMAEDIAGSVARLSGQPEAALAAFRRAVEAVPGQAAYWHNLAIALRDTNDAAGGVAALERALAFSPAEPRTLWGRCFIRLPVLSASEEAARTAREDYAAGLEELEAAVRLDTPWQREAWAVAAGSMQPFYAHYQGGEDLALQRRYAGLIQRILRARFPDWATPAPMPPKGADGRWRIGFASAFFRDHSVWKLPLRGWLAGLDRTRFEVFAYHLGAATDSITEQARQLAEHFVHLPPEGEAAGAAGAAARIRADALHALIYPEIGMEPQALRLAALFLAPVQAYGLGHPVTTGFDSIGHYLTPAAMETAASDAAFGEKLVRLPGIGGGWEPPVRATLCLTRADYGLLEKRPLLLSCQSLFKHQPRHDRLFVALARRLPQAAIVFLENESRAVTEFFAARLEAAFAQAGLDWRQHCLWVARQSGEGFQRLMELADVFLDSPGWSGFNSSCEATVAGLPVVTLPGVLTRERHAAAVLRMAGLEEGIATDEEDYVRRVAALVEAPQAQQQQRRVVIAAAAGRLAEGGPAIAALEDWLEREIAACG